jgi:hypothetical protein
MNEKTVFVLWLKIAQLPDAHPYAVFSMAPDIDEVRIAFEAVCLQITDAESAQYNAEHMGFDGFPTIPELNAFDIDQAIFFANQEQTFIVGFGKFKEDDLPEEIPDSQ